MTGEKNLSHLGLGASRMGSFNNPQSLSESLRLIRGALDLGVTTIDTANIYGQGDSERTIGRALAGGARERAFVITKGGCLFSARAQALRWIKPLVRPLLSARGQGRAVSTRRGGELRADWSAPALIRSLDASLRRLRTDRVDGFLLHSPPTAIAADPVVHEALATMRDAGKARHVGISCDDRDSLRAAFTMPALTMLELPVDLLGDVAGFAAEIELRGIIVIAREVISLRPELTPADAVREALGKPLVGCALVGTTRLTHLADLQRQL
jgi:aryl-alcohol dehydrogenase-like predicted oxidoreductase